MTTKPTLSDGHQVPSGHGAVLIALFDPMRMLSTAIRGREFLRRQLTLHTRALVTDEVLDAAIEPLLERKLIERRAPLEPELDPLDRPIERFRGPDDPEDGETVYGPTVLGCQCARLCNDLTNPRGGVWLLGEKRLDDQVVLTVGQQGEFGCTLGFALLACCCSSEKDVRGAVARLVEARLLEEKRGRFRLAAEGLAKYGDLAREFLSLGTATSPQRVPDPIPARGMLFDGRNFHAEVVRLARDAFRAGDYQSAISRACLGLQEAVRQRTGSREDGIDLVNSAFFKSKPPLVRVNDGDGATALSEQEGVAHLFRGMVQAVRNPHAHELRTHDETYALECLGLVSMLFRYLDRSAP